MDSQTTIITRTELRGASQLFGDTKQNVVQEQTPISQDSLIFKKSDKAFVYTVKELLRIQTEAGDSILSKPVGLPLQYCRDEPGNVWIQQKDTSYTPAYRERSSERFNNRNAETFGSDSNNFELEGTGVPNARTPRSGGWTTVTSQHGNQRHNKGPPPGFNSVTIAPEGTLEGSNASGFTNHRGRTSFNRDTNSPASANMNWQASKLERERNAPPGLQKKINDQDQEWELENDKDLGDESIILSPPRKVFPSSQLGANAGKKPNGNTPSGRYVPPHLTEKSSGAERLNNLPSPTKRGPDGARSQKYQNKREPEIHDAQEFEAWKQQQHALHQQQLAQKQKSIQSESSAQSNATPFSIDTLFAVVSNNNNNNNNTDTKEFNWDYWDKIPVVETEEDEVQEEEEVTKSRGFGRWFAPTQAKEANVEQSISVEISSKVKENSKVENEFLLKMFASVAEAQAQVDKQEPVNSKQAKPFTPQTQPTMEQKVQQSQPLTSPRGTPMRLIAGDLTSSPGLSVINSAAETPANDADSVSFISSLLGKTSVSQDQQAQQTQQPQQQQIPQHLPNQSTNALPPHMMMRGPAPSSLPGDKGPIPVHFPQQQQQLPPGVVPVYGTKGPMAPQFPPQATGEPNPLAMFFQQAQQGPYPSRGPMPPPHMIPRGPHPGFPPHPQQGGYPPVPPQGWPMGHPMAQPHMVGMPPTGLEKWFGNNIYQQAPGPMPPLPANAKMMSLEEIERAQRVTSK